MNNYQPYSLSFLTKLRKHGLEAPNAHGLPVHLQPGIGRTGRQGSLDPKKPWNCGERGKCVIIEARIVVASIIPRVTVYEKEDPQTPF